MRGAVPQASLALLSPAKVVVVEADPGKRALAQTLGADVGIDPLSENALEAIQEKSGKNGAAVVLDFVGVDSTMTLGSAVLGRGGLFVRRPGRGSVPFSFLGLVPEAILTSSNWGSRNELAELLALARRGDPGPGPVDEGGELVHPMRCGAGDHVVCGAGRPISANVGAHGEEEVAPPLDRTSPP
ncbi:zinc-binding dehydrogenase [Rhodococcus jostii]|uniref:zinc-binding dehydrogenase n=1 Tax=Rhodococcus jostii TaxID=132919 RepID=UPI0036509B13